MRPLATSVSIAAPWQGAAGARRRCRHRRIGGWVIQAVCAALAGSSLVGCNSIWGIDDLDYSSSSATEPGGWGTGAGGHGGTASLGGGGHGGMAGFGGAGAEAGTGGTAGAGGTAGGGGSGGSLCSAPCDSPPNALCYQAQGSCDPGTGDCSYTALANGTSCGQTTCGAYGSCIWDGPCSHSGHRTRTCTDYACQGGTCSSTQRSEDDPCSRTVANGTACGNGQYCCSQSCVARNSNANCGSCGVSCGSQTCVQLHDHAGQYSCTCFGNAFCQGAGFGGGATCYNDGVQTVCNCQCPGGLLSCTGQCAGGGTCADIPGHNYCHY